METIHPVAANEIPGQQNDVERYRTGDLLTKIEQMECGAAVVTRQSQFVCWNSTAQHLVESSNRLSVSSGRLLPVAACSRRGWLHLLATASSRVVELFDADNVDDGPIAVRGMASHAACRCGGHVLLMFSRPRLCSTMVAEAWMRANGLTPAEQRVLCSLIAGSDVVDIATELGNSEHTVRTHVRRILDKAGVASMRKLLHKIALLPSVPTMHGSGCGAVESPCRVRHNDKRHQQVWL